MSKSLEKGRGYDFESVIVNVYEAVNGVSDTLSHSLNEESEKLISSLNSSSFVLGSQFSLPPLEGIVSHGA